MNIWIFFSLLKRKKGYNRSRILIWEIYIYIYIYTHTHTHTQIHKHTYMIYFGNSFSLQIEIFTSKQKPVLSTSFKTGRSGNNLLTFLCSSSLQYLNREWHFIHIICSLVGHSPHHSLLFIAFIHLLLFISPLWHLSIKTIKTSTY